MTAHLHQNSIGAAYQRRRPGSAERGSGQHYGLEQFWTIGQQRFVMLLLLVYLVGFHLRLSLYSSGGAVLLPMYPMLVPAMILGLMQLNRLVRGNGPLLLLLVIFIFVQPLLSFAPLSSDSGNLTNMAQLLASVLSALIVIQTASTLPATWLRMLFFGFWAALMILAVAEGTGLGPVMASVRESIYAGSGRGLYDFAARDELIYGRVRPSALASEPSFLADSWMSMTLLVLLLGRMTGARYAWIQFALMVVVGYALAPSSRLLFYLLALAVWILWPRSKAAGQRLVVIGPAVAVILALSSQGVLRIVGQINSAETGSYFARVMVGPHVGLAALREYPLLGFGIGNDEAATPLIQQTWQDLGGFARFPWFAPFSGDDLMGSGFWWQWVYMGLLGTAVFLMLIAAILRRLQVASPWRVIVCSSIVWYSAFAFIDPACWFLIAVFAVPVVARTRDRHESSALDEECAMGRPT